jgi:DNA-binding CsgD family transcriptional regulator
MYIKRLNTDLEEDALLTMIDRVDTIKKNNEIHKALIEMKDRYSLRNAAYMGYNMGSLTQAEPYASVTYSEEWVNQYREKSYLDIDPVLRAVQKSILPIDWQSFDISNPKVRRFFNEAKDAGVGRNGISIPVRGRNGDSGIFSITTNAKDADWVQFKRQYMRDFQVLAVHFHQSVLIANNVIQPVFKLSTREVEVLYWTACGKTGEEAALILGISKRGVRFHVCNIMHKLNCTNVTHAVAKALYFNLIKPPK